MSDLLADGAEATTLLYLHGFASSPGGTKAQALGSILAPRGIEVVAPDLNLPSFETLSFRAMSDEAMQLADRIEPDLVIGSSLGAMVALDLARRGLSVPLILIAPALGFGNRWTERIPNGADGIEVHHYGFDETRRIHAAFFHEMQSLDLDSSSPAVPVLIIMGTNDESVPYELVRDVWERWRATAREGSDLITIEGGDHGLTANLPDITAAVTRALELNAATRTRE